MSKNPELRIGLIAMSFCLTTFDALAVDPYVADLYKNYCQACHTVKETGAPQTFDTAEWQKRLKKGQDTLVNNAILGMGSMPAQGGCQECTYEDFEDLIRLMASEEELNSKELSK